MTADKRRASHLRTRYGITPEQYQELLDKQDGCCYVCQKPAEAFTKRLAVDHNHKTGEIRGALCTYCNHRLVGRHTDSSLLRRIADYLDKTTGWFVPEKHRTTKRKRKKNATKPKVK